MTSKKRSLSSDADMIIQHKEWDQASCPICMDHPHNAVLIICSFHDKGCRPLICDTSYRHSNCLDRFKMLKKENVNLFGLSMNSGDEEQGGTSVVQISSVQNNVEKSREEGSLRCPLCRGVVLGWKVVEDARMYLNLKPRSCSHESCCFSGNYGELRKHARRDHPMARPADVDPCRQREWHRLEDEREVDDIVSAVRSAMPSAVLVGDYAIESRNSPFSERIRSGSRVQRGRLLSTLFWFQMISSFEDETPQRVEIGDAENQHRHRRGDELPSLRTYLWGENLLGLQDEVIELEDDEEEDEEQEQDLNVPSDLGDNRRRRPRLRHDQ